MELTLEAIALFALKLAYETEGASPILRDDQLMAEYEREVFGLLVRAADVKAIQLKVDVPLSLALKTVGGTDTVLGRELQRLAEDVRKAQTMEALNAPLGLLKDYLKDIQ
ncbi:hypothetical protein BK634_30265 [Pseudomonas chlororaphis]|jgi:hypothetical protein|nr:hypothetical protein BK634_30265 [Pseudomonas chlororaphis]